MGVCPCTSKCNLNVKSTIYEDKDKIIEENERDIKQLKMIEKKDFGEKMTLKDRNSTLLSKETTATSFLECSSGLIRRISTKEKSYRIVIYGPPESGKSTIALQMTKNKVKSFYIPSVFTEKWKIPVSYNHSNVFFEFIVPPVSLGQKNIIEAHCYIVVFDLTSRESFSKAEAFINQKLANIDKSIYLVGNKCELKHFVSKQLIDNICIRKKIPFFEVSALKAFGFYSFSKAIKEDIIKF